MFVKLWKYIVHAVTTVVVCIDKEILRRKTHPLLNLKSLESGGDPANVATIFQTHECAMHDWNVYQATAQTVNMNLDFNYKFFTAAERRLFLVEHFGVNSEQVRAYDTVVNGAIKADIFRICILYVFGGVYLDCKSTTIHPLRTFVPADTDFAIFMESYGSRLGNGFIASTPGNALLGCLMKEAVRRTLNKEYGQSPLDVTGPEMFGSVLRQFLGVQVLEKKRYIGAGGLKIDLLGSINFFDSFMYTQVDLPVIKRQPDDYFFSLKRLVKRYEIWWIMGRYFAPAQ